MPNSASKKTRWLKIVVSYDGAAYAGWQIQNNARTVQETIQNAWFKITQERVSITSSGRTDSGVHALGQVIAVQTKTQIPLDKLRLALNAKTPEDIAFLSLEQAKDNFHATYHAIKKRYRYQIFNGRIPPVFIRNYVWYYPVELNVQKMHLAAQAIIGTHDFSCFESVGSQRATSIRTIYDLSVTSRAEQGGELITLEIEGNGFLYNMVRAITGTLTEVGVGKKPSDWVAEVLASQDRSRAGQTAPAQGLFLLKVTY